MIFLKSAHSIQLSRLVFLNSACMYCDFSPESSLWETDTLRVLTMYVQTEHCMDVSICVREQRNLVSCAEHANNNFKIISSNVTFIVGTGRVFDM